MTVLDLPRLRGALLNELSKLAKEVQLVAGKTKSRFKYGCVQSTLLRTNYSKNENNYYG